MHSIRCATKKNHAKEKRQETIWKADKYGVEMVSMFGLIKLTDTSSARACIVFLYSSKTSIEDKIHTCIWHSLSSIAQRMHARLRWEICDRQHRLLSTYRNYQDNDTHKYHLRLIYWIYFQLIRKTKNTQREDEREKHAH